MFTYTYSVQDDFPNHKADAGALHAEIKDSAIVAVLDGVTVHGDVTCDVMFVTELSVGDNSILDNIVAEHQGEPLPQPESVWLSIYRQNPEPELDEQHKAVIWVDTNDNNKTYLVFRRGADDQVKVQLT